MHAHTLLRRLRFLRIRLLRVSTGQIGALQELPRCTETHPHPRTPTHTHTNVEGKMEHYSCCQGYYDCLCWKAGSLGESSFPDGCNFLEACLWSLSLSLSLSHTHTHTHTHTHSLEGFLLLHLVSLSLSLSRSISISRSLALSLSLSLSLPPPPPPTHTHTHSLSLSLALSHTQHISGRITWRYFLKATIFIYMLMILGHRIF
jgi:hypothetical protein